MTDVPLAQRKERRARPSSEPATDVLLASLATRQGGVVTRSQLSELGLSCAAIGRRAASRRLVRLHRGVYAVGHLALTSRGRLTAALLAVGDGAVVSHRTAAAAWGMLPASEPPVCVTVAGREVRRRDGIEIHATASLEAPDVRRLDGVSVTAPARTLVDLARAGHPRLDRIVAEAQVLRLVRRTDVEAAIARARDRRGLGELRRSLAAVERGPTRTELERRMLRIVTEAGLPRPEVNRPLGRFTVDFLWREERVVVESDGWAAHSHRRAFESDRARDAELHARGYLVVRFTWRQITETPLLVGARLAAVLAVRA